MATSSLVDRTHELSRKLGALLRILPTDDPLHRTDLKKDASSFLFEVVVLIELLLNLSEAGLVTVVRRSGHIVLARAPASKRKKSYFICTLGGRSYDLLPSIDVADRMGGTQAPDLTLHDHIPETQLPDYSNVRAIWDAKLRGETGAVDNEPIAKGEFATFLLMCDLLSVPKPGESRDVLPEWKSAFDVSALISNGRIPHQSLVFMIEKGISVTELFVTRSTQCKPLRHEHLAVTAGTSASPKP